jgi:hypothetical protein
MSSHAIQIATDAKWLKELALKSQANKAGTMADLCDFIVANSESLTAQLAEREEIIAGLVVAAEDAIGLMLLQGWDKCPAFTPQYGIYSQLNNAISRASSVKTSGGWLPISQAPREGSRILTIDGDLQVVLKFTGGHWVSYDGDGNWGRCPTHWRPLPLPPESSEGLK